jgi:hypothetical protein
MSSSRPATPPMPSASCPCSSARSRGAARHRGQLAADGGYASRDNLTAAKAPGVKDVAFHKKRGLAVEDMVKSHWVYRKLRNFRAGIEAGISCLKRAYGLARCTWRGLDYFKTYIWPAVVAQTNITPQPRPAASVTAGQSKPACPPVLAKRFFRPLVLFKREKSPPHKPLKRPFMDGH